MRYVLSGLLVVWAIEMLFRLPLLQVIKASTLTTQKAASVMFSSFISDHWKERAILLYAGIIFTNTLRLGLYLLGIFTPIVAVVILANFQAIDLLSFIMTLEGVMFMTIVSTGYLFARKRFV